MNGLKELHSLQVPMASIKNPMKNIHMLAIQYLAYLVKNKQKLGNKQAPIQLG
jgi:hypothetical protein